MIEDYPDYPKGRCYLPCSGMERIDRFMKPGTVTIAGKLNDDLPRGTWASVVKRAGLKE